MCLLETLHNFPLFTRRYLMPILKCTLKEHFYLLGLDACGFGYGLIASPFEHCIGPVRYVKFGEFFIV
jgi:hypothetical protein